MVGSNLFRITQLVDGQFLAPIMIDRLALVAFRKIDGHLLLDLKLFDEFNALVLSIEANQLIYSVTELWDIQIVGSKLAVRADHGNIFLEINFCPPNRIMIERGRLLRNGVELIIRPKYLLLVNLPAVLAHNLLEAVGGPALAFIFGPPPIGSVGAAAEICFDSIPRYLADNADALAWAEADVKNDEGPGE